jgi:cytosine/adenosine deaminase-related metal-dependent hydrolase
VLHYDKPLTNDKILYKNELKTNYIKRTFIRFDNHNSKCTI